MPAGAEPIQAINISAQLAGDKAEVIVSVFRGRRFGEINEQVSRLLLAEGETASVTDLKKYGFKPITVKMLAVETSVANVPVVSNPSGSLKAFVSPAVSTVPSFEVRFANLSSKNIAAIAWHTEAGGWKLMSGLPQGKHGDALIMSGDEYEMSVKVGGIREPSDYVTFAIDAVIYSDGTFVGEDKEAAMFLSFTEGRKRALSAVIPILESATSDKERINLVGLIARIDSIGHGGETKNGRPATADGIAFEGVIREVVGDLRGLDATKANAELRKDFLGLTLFYKEWQDKLSDQNAR